VRDEGSSGPVTVRRVLADEWRTVKEVRLRALRDAPDFFWATFDQEVDKPEAWWADFIAVGAWFIAERGGEPLGIAAGLVPREANTKDVHLISMWVAPEARGERIAADLIREVVGWAGSEGATGVMLEVTETNASARRLYERCGFVPTGKTQVLPREPHVIEHEMRLRLT
jgi:ribosomal protein S18 acetylase RimI-like enzyme